MAVKRSPVSELTRQTEAKNGSMLNISSGSWLLIEVLSFVSKVFVKWACILMKLADEVDKVLLLLVVGASLS